MSGAVVKIYLQKYNNGAVHNERDSLVEL
jgi:hypothetical protein